MHGSSGCRICIEESGQATRSFQCPYHAWTYNFEGKLIAALNLTKMPDIDRDEYGLVKVHVREYLGYVWLSLADEPPSFEDDATGAIENFMECYHCATIHPELTEVLPEFADGLAAQFFVGHGAEFGEGIKDFTADGSESWDLLPGVDEDQNRGHFAITIKPTLFLNLVPDHVTIHRMFPITPDRTIVECDWLYLPRVVESGKDLTSSVELFHGVNHQDFAACERCQPGMSSKVYAHGGVLVRSEHHIGLFHDWLIARVGDLVPEPGARSPEPRP